MTGGAASPLYLDHNATTPVDRRVLDKMIPYFTELYGNASSVEHVHGHRAQTAVANARAQVAARIGARENEIVFTGSCTEASNLAILGVARAHHHKRHVVTSAIEHPSVMEPMRQLEREGFELSVIGVDRHGRVNPDDVAEAIRDDTALVSVMAANNEVGTIQPIAEIGAACEIRGVPFHTDLAQLLAHRGVDVQASKVHLASISGHKAYGPKGVGALYVRSRSPRVRLEQTTWGGGQERGLRSGTLAVPLIVGLGAALDLAANEAEHQGNRLRAMCSDFFDLLNGRLDGVELNGHPTERIPGNLSISIAGVEPLALIHRLNSLASFSASSACATDKVKTSHVLLAMFEDTLRARQAFRISPGHGTSHEEFMAFGEALVFAVANVRQFAA